MTDAHMALTLGWSVATFYNTMRDYPEFLEAVKEGRGGTDELIINAMARRAVGYDIQTEKVFANGTRLTVLEHVPADPGAGMNWLANRRGWRRNVEAIVVPPDPNEEPPQGEQYSNRQLALAALALMSEAAYEGETIEAQANEEIDDGEDEAASDHNARPQARDDARPVNHARRSRRPQSAVEETSDPDFDF